MLFHEKFRIIVKIFRMHIKTEDLDEIEKMLSEPRKIHHINGNTFMFWDVEIGIIFRARIDHTWFHARYIFSESSDGVTVTCIANFTENKVRYNLNPFSVKVSNGFSLTN